MNESNLRRAAIGQQVPQKKGVTMEFDAGKLCEKFRDTIRWMLQGKCNPAIRRDIGNCHRWKNALASNPDSEEALRFLVTVKVTNAWYREARSGFDAALNSFIGQHKGAFRTKVAIGALASLVDQYSRFSKKQDGAEWAKELLTEFPTLKDFTDDLYQLRKEGKKGKVLYEKGADNYLRDFGYWDVIPIDIHERRFLVRTGIYQVFSSRGKQDPLAYRDLQDALSLFCSSCLEGEVVDSIDLGHAPGIVDFFIWWFCTGKGNDMCKGYAICGSTPQCEKCPLSEACLFEIARNGKPTMHQVNPARPEMTSRIGPIAARIIDAQKSTPGKCRWEIRAQKSAYSKQLLARFPVTHKTNPDGHGVTVRSRAACCQASLHCYKSGCTIGFYIGSATRRLNDRTQKHKWEEFVRESGLCTHRQSVKLTFQGQYVDVS